MKIKTPSIKEINDVKNFILHIIKFDFNYDFNPDWHWDISDIESTYLNRKSILLIAEEKGEVIGTIAGRPYDRNYEQLRGRYTDTTTLGIWRHYIKKDNRGKGVGTKLLKLLEEKARAMGYKNLYLHTQRTIPGSLEYWISKGYTVTDDSNDEFQTVHLEKTL